MRCLWTVFLTLLVTSSVLATELPRCPSRFVHTVSSSCDAPSRTTLDHSRAKARCGIFPVLAGDFRAICRCDQGEAFADCHAAEGAADRSAGSRNTMVKKGRELALPAPQNDRIVPITESSILIRIHATTDTPDPCADGLIRAAYIATGEAHTPCLGRKLGIRRRRPIAGRLDI